MYRIFKVFLFLLVLNISLACSAKNFDTPIRVFYLKNGHKVVIKEVHANPIVTIDTWVKTGTADETPENNGISHFLEHLMFKGTKNHKNGEIEKILESKGARFNAATSKDFTHYYVTIASDYLETAIKLHADMLQNPVIPEEEMEKERGVVLEEIRRANDNPQRIMLMNLFQLIFEKHPYKMDTLGPQKVIKTIPKEEMLKYFNNRYAPENLITVIVGDIDTEKAHELVKENFNSEYNPDNKSKVSTRIYEPEQKKPRKKIERGNYKSGYLYMGFKGVPINSTRDSYALDMAASILGSGKTSRLHQSLKEDLNLVTGIGSGHYSLKDDSVFLISADFEPEKYQAVETAILEELERFREGSVTKEELERAKTKARRSFVYSNESVESIAQSIGYSMVMSGTIEHYKNHLQYIDNVRIRDIKRVAKKYLDSSRRAVSVILPEEVEVNNVVLDKKVIKNSARSELSNGSVLITNKNTSNDIISMSVFFKGGRYLEPKPGTAALLRKTLLYGTKNRSYKKLIREIENMGITLSPSASSDYFVIKLKSTKSDFDKAFEILTDVIKNPTFEEKYIKQNKEDILANIKKSRDQPLKVASEKFITEMYKNHPYGDIGPIIEKNLPDVTREEVVNYWSRTFVPANMVVSVAGDIEHEGMAHRLLAAFPSSNRPAPEMNYDSEYSPLKENKVIKTDYDSQAAWMIMGWPVGDLSDNKELASFRMINAYLSGGLSSKLHKTFREEQGLAYSVGSSYSPSMDKGYFILLIGTAPKNIELVREKFLKEIELIKTQPLSDEELEYIKNKIIGSYALSQETNMSKAYKLGKLEVIDKEFGFNYDFPDLINSVTAEDVINTANKYFSYPYILSVVAPQEE